MILLVVVVGDCQQFFFPLPLLPAFPYLVEQQHFTFVFLSLLVRLFFSFFLSYCLGNRINFYYADIFLSSLSLHDLMYGKLQCNVTFLSSFVWRIKPGTKSHDLKKLKTKSSEHKHELDKNTKTIFTTWGEEVTQAECRLFSQTGMFFF